MTTAHTPTPTEFFATETADLPTCKTSELVDLAPGDILDLRITPVAKRLGDTEVRKPNQETTWLVATALRR